MADAVIAISLDKRVSILQFIRQNTPRKYPGIMACIERLRIGDKRPGVYFATFHGNAETGWHVDVLDLIEDGFREKDNNRELMEDCYGGDIEWWK